MRNNITIRLMQKSDLNEIATLYAQVYTQTDIDEKWTAKSARQLMNYWLAQQPDLSFIALVADKIVGGFTAGIKPWWDGNHLVDGEIFVDYNYHKQSIGSRLSKVMYATALKKYKITSVDLVTFSKNGFPLSWYESLGFKKSKLIIINGEPKKIIKSLLTR